MLTLKQLQDAKFDTLKSKTFASFSGNGDVVQEALEEYLELNPSRTIIDYSFACPDGYAHYVITLRYLE